MKLQRCTSIITAFLAATLAVEANIIQNGNFEDQFRQATNRGQAHLSGELPRHWNDDSGWNEVIGHYQGIGDALTGDLVVSGQQGFRMSHRGSRSDRHTRLQVSQIVELEEGKTYRLAGAFRSPDQPLPGGHRRGFNLVVRQLGSPYASYVTISPNLDTNWNEYEASFTVPETGRFKVIAILNNEGTADLDALSLTEINLQAYEGPLRKENFLPNGRFPVGVGGPYTWSFDWQVPDIKQVNGPLGPTAIHLPGRFALRSPPIAINAGRPYTFSVYLKSDTANLPVAVAFTSVARTGNEPLVQKSWRVGTSWQRYTFTTTMPPAQADTIYIRLSSPNARGISIDGLRLEEGENANDYNLEARAETVIGLPPAALMQGIYLEDETAVLPIGATGVWGEDAQIEIRVTDVFGSTKTLDPIPLPTNGNLYKGELSIAPDAVDPERPLGSFRIAAQVVNKSGEKLSPTNEMTFMRVPAPYKPEELNHYSPAGIHARFNDYGFLMAQKLGFKWIRNHDMVPGVELSKWSYVEPQQGRYQWPDEMLQNLTNHGLLALAVVDTTPQWANNLPEGHVSRESDFLRRNYAPRDIEEYQNFLRTFAKRYENQIFAYEIWNEPYSATFFRDYVNGETVHARPQDLADLHIAAYEVLKEVNPEIKVVGVTSGTRPSTFIQSAFEQGMAGNYDVLGFHAYSHFNSELPLVNNPVLLIEEAAKHGDNPSEIWNTEGSPMPRVSFFEEVNPIPDHTFNEWSMEANHATVAASYARYMLAGLAHRADKIFFYSVEVRPAMVEERGFKLVEPTGIPTPGLGAVAALNNMLNRGAKFVEAIEPTENISVFLFEGGGLTFAALQSIDGKETSWTPQDTFEDATIMDMFGNPIKEIPAVSAVPTYIVYKGNKAEELKARLQ